MTYHTIAEIKRANHDTGQHFFESSTMRFFGSRIAPGVIGGRFFITSEQRERDCPRLYTVRVAHDDSSIDTVGEFQGYPTLRAARKAAYALTELHEGPS